MGKPMRNRILSIALAFSMIAVAFAAVPAMAAVTYTGTVATYDDGGNARTDFLWGEDVFVKVKVLEDGAPGVFDLTIRLVRTYDSHIANTLLATTDAGGSFNSTSAANALHTTHSINGDVVSYYVIVYVAGEEAARSEIVVRNVGLTLIPNPGTTSYWPGETISMKLGLTHDEASQVFYIQVTNITDIHTYLNLSAMSAPTGYWTGSFVVGADWPDGTFHVNVRSNLDNSIWYSRTFTVEAFLLNVEYQRTSYLPGETALITYTVQDLATLSMVSTGLTIQYNVSYLNKTHNLTWKLGSLPITETLWNLTIPTNGTAQDSIGLFSDILVNITATMVAGNRTATDLQVLSIGLLDASVNLNDNVFIPGETVEVTVSADVLGDSLDGADVSVAVYKNGTDLVAAYGASGLVTDQSGSAGYAFTLAQSRDLNTSVYIVQATVAKVGYSTVRETQFSVGPDWNLLVSLDRFYYYGGQEATATFKTILNGQEIGGQVVGYVIMLGPTVLAIGNTAEGSVSVEVPQAVFGTLSVDAKVILNGIVIERSAAAAVLVAQLGLSAEKSNYRPGEKVVFDWSIVTGLSTADLSYEIVDSNGVAVKNGTLAFAKTGSFEYTVPDASPLLPSSYDATMRLSTTEGALVTAAASVNIIPFGVELSISVAKSPYVTGDFRPGQKVTINYDLNFYQLKYSTAIRLHVEVSGDPVALDVIVGSPTGKITYSIPNDASVGEHTLTVTAYDAALGFELSTDDSTFIVNNQASGWDRSVGGLSVIDLVLLILLIIVIIMLIVVPMMKDRMARPKPPEESKPMTMAEEPGKAPPPPAP